MFKIDYVILFTIATIDTVIIYSTESLSPIIVAGNIHFASLSDISWLSNKAVAISSNDGYCSFILFEEQDILEKLSD